MKITNTLCLFFCFQLAITASIAQQSKETLSHTLRVLSCIAWWSHDAVGYRPAMLLMIENISGHDITGEEVPFQGRFTDLRNGFITVARNYRRTPIQSHERFVLLLRAPKSFELPIDTGIWPQMECKALCKLSNNNIQKVDHLFVTHLTPITMTDEDAHTQLIAQAERNPLLAMRDSDDPVSEPPKNKKMPRTPKNLPKIGDDFYVFEKVYGKPCEFHVGTIGSVDDLTWAHYHANIPLYNVYAGSRNGSKVDVVIVTLAAASTPKETDILSFAKMLAGGKKEEPINPFVHSVHYLSSGRSEIMSTGIRDRKVLSFHITDNHADNDSINKIAVLITHLPGDAESALFDYIKHVDFLHLAN